MSIEIRKKVKESVKSVRWMSHPQFMVGRICGKVSFSVKRKREERDGWWKWWWMRHVCRLHVAAHSTTSTWLSWSRKETQAKGWRQWRSTSYDRLFMMISVSWALGMARELWNHITTVYFQFNEGNSKTHSAIVMPPCFQFLVACSVS